MKKAFKSLFRKGDANIVKILCLSVGLAIGLFLLAEVIFEQSYDNFVPARERVYQVGESYAQTGSELREYSQTPGGWGPGFKAGCPAIETATRFTGIADMVLQTEDNKEFYGHASLVDTCFFDIFPRKILMGEAPSKGLAKAGTAYISSKMLERAGKDIIGKTVKWKNYPQFTVTIIGVFEAFPENTNLPYMDILVSMPTIGQIMWDGSENWSGNDRYKTFIRLKEGRDISHIEGDVQKVLDQHIPPEELKKAGVELKTNFMPIADIYTSSPYNRIMNIVFLAFGIIMLTVAVLNYILLVISSMVNRAKGIATYRCYGAKSKDIYRMILHESILHGAISLALAVLIIFGLQDLLQEQLGHSLESLFPVSTIVICLLVTAGIIVVCGLMPGYLYTRIPVTYAYRRYTENKRSWKLGLLFAQFLLTTFFVCLLAVIGWEYHTLTNFKPGFEYKSVLYVYVSGSNISDSERMTCLQELKKLPCVQGVTYGYQALWDKCSGNNVLDDKLEKEYMNIADMYLVGDDYHKVLDIPIVEGQAFTPQLMDTINREIMVSQRFVKKMEELAGWTGSPIGKQVYITEHTYKNVQQRLTICGVYKEIHVGSQMAEEADDRPTVMFYSPVPAHLLYIRLRHMSPENRQAVQEVVDKCLKNPDDYKVMSADLAMGEQYDGVKLIRNSVCFAGLCILAIALIGLIAYIRDEVSRRRSEIAIRTIHGATVADVQLLLQKDLLKIALPATLIGALLAWLASDKLLQLFAVKIELAWYLFAGCIFLVLLVVVALSAVLILKAARTNPTENLRTE